MFLHLLLSSSFRDKQYYGALPIPRSSLGHVGRNIKEVLCMWVTWRPSDAYLPSLCLVLKCFQAFADLIVSKVVRVLKVWSCASTREGRVCVIGSSKETNMLHKAAMNHYDTFWKPRLGPAACEVHGSQLQRNTRWTRAVGERWATLRATSPLGIGPLASCGSLSVGSAKDYSATSASMGSRTDGLCPAS